MTLHQFYDCNKPCIVINGADGFLGHHLVNYFLSVTDYNILVISRSTQNRMLNAAIDRRVTSRCGRVAVFDLDFREPIQDYDVVSLMEECAGEPVCFVNCVSDTNLSPQHASKCWKNNTILIDNVLSVFSRMLKHGTDENLRREVKFIQISSDEVYGPMRSGDHHNELSQFMPHTHYAASKIAQEALCVAYANTWDFPLYIVNTMNLFGERQSHYKFIPTAIARRLLDKPVQVYVNTAEDLGNDPTRMYLHCSDIGSLILKILKHVPIHHLYKYCACGGEDMTARDVVALVSTYLGKSLNFTLERIVPKDKQAGYLSSFGMDCTRAKQDLDWKPSSFSNRLKQTVDWFAAAENRGWLATQEQ